MVLLLIRGSVCVAVLGCDRDRAVKSERKPKYESERNSAPPKDKGWGWEDEACTYLDIGHAHVYAHVHTYTVKYTFMHTHACVCLRQSVYHDTCMWWR